MLDITALMPWYRLASRTEFPVQRPGGRLGRGARSRGNTPGSPSRKAAHTEFAWALVDALFAPWAAVSSGIVIAAALTLLAPQATLAFPRSTSACRGADCLPATARHSRPLTGRVIDLRALGTHDIDGKVSPIAVQYQLLVPPRHNNFMAVILISGRRSLGTWNLRFELPGAHIGSVMWASWTHEGPSGVVMQSTPLPWPRSSANQARIVISGTGVPRWPRHCVIDDVRCSFQALTLPGHDGSG